jgi:hypothetical protein
MAGLSPPWVTGSFARDASPARRANRRTARHARGVPPAGRHLGLYSLLTGTELEHAHGITRELTTLLRDRLAPPMRFVKLEGDAVLCYADAKSFDDGERLVELIETCYFAFSNRLLDMQRSTTCPCAACRAIGSLDLKFVTHYGSFVVERDGEREDVLGPAAILVHRLLKNTVIESGGPPGRRPMRFSPRRA